MPENEAKHADALQLIFSLFLGLLLVVFIGVGVWTFYPQPSSLDSPEQQELQELYQEQERLYGKGGAAPEPVDDAEIQRIQTRINELNEIEQERQSEWARNNSIILLAFATLLMAISLFLPESMKVFSNGILLGGLFTVVYGTGWSFAGGDSRARFFVVAVALVLSLAIGYLRFIRGRRESAAVVPLAAGEGDVLAAGEGGAALAELSARLDALEARTNAAATALSGTARERD